MGTLIGIAFVAGLVTALSPCVLPVLPVVFAGSATGSPRRPYAVIAGLVVSFTAFTLAATLLLDALGLPNDLLRNIAIAVVIVVALSLVFPQLARVVERPFAALGRRAPRDVGGGFVLGLSLGLLFTPCAGPIIAAVSVVAATREFSVEAVLVTLAYALGAGLVLLVLAVAAQRGLALPSLRSRAPQIRQGLGAMMVAVAVVMILGLDARLASNVPGYTQALQGLEESAGATSRIDRLVDAGPNPLDEPATPATEAPTEASAVPTETAPIDPGPPAATPDAADPAVQREIDLAATLPDFGPAPDFAQIEGWINAEGFSLADLRGKVVLIDFWTYSCINCLRTLPHLKSWHEKYADEGLVIVGVHTPEFAFERERDNVEGAVHDLGIEYAVALDPDFGTWQAWGNRFWPAKYFIDAEGRVRHGHFGEGAYEESEEVIRGLLREAGNLEQLDELASAGIADRTPTSVQTPEIYLGYQRMEHYVGDRIETDTPKRYDRGELLGQGGFSFDGNWTVEPQRSVAGEPAGGAPAAIRILFVGNAVHLVIGPDEHGGGSVDVLIDSEPVQTLEIDSHRLYTLADGDREEFKLLELRFSPGVS
ncbi:MAG: cytochrome c biogenesis protein CcdA, partial [Gaiellaceae bacterium]